MLTANQLKSGSIIEYNNAPHAVENVIKQTPSARGATTIYKIRVRNIITKNKADITGKGDDTFQEPDVSTCELQFLYMDGETGVFMDLESYEQHELHISNWENEKPYILEDMEGITGILLEGNIVNLRLPDSVEMKLVECDPAIKGASATARTKPAKTETGLEIQVPEYMQNGEIVKVDTATGKFTGRA